MKPILIAIPVFNEERHLAKVLREIRGVVGRKADILIVDDGSTDATPDISVQHKDVAYLPHDRNLGYGASLIDAFNWAARYQYQWVITMTVTNSTNLPACMIFLLPLPPTTPISSVDHVI